MRDGSFLVAGTSLQNALSGEREARLLSQPHSLLGAFEYASTVHWMSACKNRVRTELTSVLCTYIQVT